MKTIFNLEYLLKPEKERKPIVDELRGTQYANEGVDYLEFLEFIHTQGIDNITVSDMNKLIEKYGSAIMDIDGFTDYYSIISTNESNRTMVKWTKAIGVMTIIVLVATIVALFK